MASKVQLEKVAELTSKGYVVVPPEKFKFGGPIKLRSPNGRVVEVNGAGEVFDGNSRQQSTNAESESESTET